jgi:signal peptidase
MAAAIRKTRDRLLDVLTWILAALGLASIASIGLSMFFGISIVLFATDSMSPTIPQNSAALAIKVPASDIKVGDVVTIDRAGQLPITHRVVEVAPSEPDEQARILTTKGDANKSVDPQTYEVDGVRRVFFSVPGVAPVFALLSDPRMLIAMGVTVLGLVVRAFVRPRHQRDEAAESPALAGGRRVMPEPMAIASPAGARRAMPSELRTAKS